MTRLYLDDADLYDIAFDWDVAEEADWIVEVLAAASVLEPGCGSGRMLEALARRGVEVVGIDTAAPMLALAQRRLGGLGVVVEADMTDFDLGRRFQGAVSPINTLLHLSPEQLARHLECMAAHLEPHSRYLVQVGLVDPAQTVPFADSHWEATRGETSLRISWVDEEIDLVQATSRQRSRIEVLTGPRAGEVVEEVHEMTAWTPATWSAAVSSSPFEEAATYDGGVRSERPRVGPDATGGLLWHELKLS